MTDMIFNELSLKPLCATKTECFNRIKDFIETYNAAKQFKFNRIRIVDALDEIMLSATGYTLNDFCCENKTLGTLLRGLLRHPFIEDDSKEEERFIENTFYINEQGEKLKAYGLAAVYLYSTIGIGFASDNYWKEFAHKLIIEGKEEQITTVLCASMPEHFESDEFRLWLDENVEVELIESDLPVEKKKIDLRDDHGKDILLNFSKKILKSPYVLSVINSLPFNPYQRNFIKKFYPIGKIEIVLTDTDRGLGIVIETTGRNLKETQVIAEILSKQYGG
jgi:hypothetical protein